MPLEDPQDKNDGPDGEPEPVFDADIEQAKMNAMFDSIAAANSDLAEVAPPTVAPWIKADTELAGTGELGEAVRECEAALDQANSANILFWPTLGQLYTLMPVSDTDLNKTPVPTDFDPDWGIGAAAAIVESLTSPVAAEKLLLEHDDSRALQASPTRTDTLLQVQRLETRNQASLDHETRDAARHLVLATLYGSDYAGGPAQ